jgi:hypothetical protein
MFKKFTKLISIVLLLNSFLLLIVSTAKAQTYKAIAVVWNYNGKWVARENTTLDKAIREAIKVCHKKYGHCVIGKTIDTTEYACIAITKGSNNDEVIYAQKGFSAQDASNKALKECKNDRGGICEIRYIGCND